MPDVEIPIQVPARLVHFPVQQRDGKPGWITCTFEFILGMDEAAGTGELVRLGVPKAHVTGVRAALRSWRSAGEPADLKINIEEPS